MYPHRSDLTTMSTRNGHTFTGYSNGYNSENPHDTETETPGNGSDGYASDVADETSSVVELAPDEFPSYFSEHDNHLFHASSSPYPLPADSPEQQVLSSFNSANIAALNFLLSDLIQFMIYCSSSTGRIT